MPLRVLLTETTLFALGIPDFPDSAPVTIRAAAPGSTLGARLDDRGRNSARDMRETLARVAVAL